MAVRSVAELLPRPFDALTIDDLQTIIADVGDPRETLFLERKRELTTDGIAKACAAFANTYGGFLVVGIEDRTDAIVGISRPAGEVQLWIKDVLRSRVLPLPPFRARFLPLQEGGEQGVMLVLVEESSTTPHLLARKGTIYVRNPGSSDPVSITDQARLLDLASSPERVSPAAGSVAHEHAHAIRKARVNQMEI